MGAVMSGGPVVDPRADGRHWRCGGGGWPDPLSARSWKRRTGDRRDRAVVAPASSIWTRTASRSADRMQAFDGVTTTLDLEAGVLPVAPGIGARPRGTLANYGAAANWAFARIGAMNGSNAEAAGGVRQCDARSPLDRQRGQRHRGGRHPRPPRNRTERGRHRHRHSQRLCPGRRRAGTDRGVPTGGGA